MTLQDRLPRAGDVVRERRGAQSCYRVAESSDEPPLSAVLALPCLGFTGNHWRGRSARLVPAWDFANYTYVCRADGGPVTVTFPVASDTVPVASERETERDEGRGEA